MVIRKGVGLRIFIRPINTIIEKKIYEKITTLFVYEMLQIFHGPDTIAVRRSTGEALRGKFRKIAKVIS